MKRCCYGIDQDYAIHGTNPNDQSEAKGIRFLDLINQYFEALGNTAFHKK